MTMRWKLPINKKWQNVRKAGDVQKLTAGGNLPDPTKVHVRLWKKLENGISVWIIDGRFVRSVFDVDFTEGGHDYVYELCLRMKYGSIMISKRQSARIVLLHELHERNLMAKGWTYSKAHEDSSRIEYYWSSTSQRVALGVSKRRVGMRDKEIQIVARKTLTPYLWFRTS